MPAFNLPVAAAYVVITATTGMIWTILVWNIRLFVRLKIRGPFGWDDIHCTIATVLGVVNSTIVILETRYGLGHHIDHVATSVAHHQQLLAWIAALLFILALCFSMLSVCCLIVRITRRTTQVWLAQGLAVVISVWAVIAFILVAFQCRFPHPWRNTPATRCIDIYRAWVAIAIVNSLLDLGNMAVAIMFLWGVKMPWRPKALILALFAARLLVIPPTLIRLRYIKKALSSKDWTFSKVDVVLVTQILLHLSIILTTLPCMKPYLSAFQSGALKAPTVDLRRISKQPARQLRPIALLPLTEPRPTLERRTSYGIRSYNAIALLPGKAGHRKRVEEWPLDTPTDVTATVTTVEHNAVDARAAERKRSMDSASMSGITRTQSFYVNFEDLQSNQTNTTPNPTESPHRTRTKTSPMEFEDT